MVSIIIPVYNAEKRIGKCIESVLNQTYKDFELILIDDGSKDDSYKICKEYEKKDHRIIALTQTNKGVSATRNRGIDISRGEYIQFIDSDDYIKENMVEELVKVATSSDADMVICGIEKHFDNKIENITPEYSGKVMVKDLEKVYPDVFRSYILHSPVNKLYKKSKIKDRFILKLYIGEDYIFNLKFLANAESIYFVDENFYYYIESKGSLISTYRDENTEIAEWLYINGIEFCKKIGLKEKSIGYLSRNFIVSFFYYMSDMYQFSDKSLKEKKYTVNNWIKNENIQNASRKVKFDSLKFEIARILIKNKMVNLFHLMLIIKSKI